MHQALHRIVGDAAKLRERLTIESPTEYVGYKLVGILACSVHESLERPCVALEYAERLLLLLEELVAIRYTEELRFMCLDTERTIDELQDAAAAEAVRRLVG